MANEVLGECVCPVCKSEHPQQVRVSEKSNKPYMNCDECGCQIFARQPASVKILRGMALNPDSLSGTQKPVSAPVPEEVPSVVVRVPPPSPVRRSTLLG